MGIAIRSVWITGARITDELDLEAATLQCPLTLAECHFEATIALDQGRCVARFFHVLPTFSDMQ